MKLDFKQKVKSNIGLSMFIFAMTIFGAIGVLRTQINLPSDVLACARGLLGAAAIFVFCLIQKARGKSPFVRINKKSLIYLIISGAMIGINWLILFEAYELASVPVVTLCYDMVSVFVVVGAFIVFKERPTKKACICLVLALFGVTLVTGIFDGAGVKSSEIRGILMALFDAALYAAVIMLNKKTTDVDATIKTMIQLLVAGLVMIPYIFIKGDYTGISLTTKDVLLTLLAGIVNTGITYLIYFKAITKIKAETISIFSFIDPVVALILSAIVLDQRLTALGIIGAVIILVSSFASEFDFKKLRKKS